MGPSFHLQILQRKLPLRQWTNGTQRSFSFGVPMVWHKQQNHHDDCCFCMVLNVKRFSKKNEKINQVFFSIKYQTLPCNLFHSQLLFLFQSSKDWNKKVEMIRSVIDPMRVMIKVNMSSKIPILIRHWPNQNCLINMS